MSQKKVSATISVTAVIDGQDGVSITSANVFYALSNQGPTGTPPADTAFTYDDFPNDNLMPGMYVWQATVVTFSDGKTEVTGKMCLGATTDFLQGTEVYATSQSGTNPPDDGTTNWKTTYIRQKGYYLWTATRVTYTDTNGTVAYLNKKCVGYWGEDGTSPWIADLSNEMDSVACDLSGKPTAAKSLTTTIALFYGQTPKSFGTPTVKRNGTAMTVNASSYANGVKVTYSNKVLTVAYDTSAVINNTDEYEITITSSDDSSVVRTLTFSVLGARPGATGEAATTYQLVPSASEIVKQKDGSFSPASLTCYCTSLKAGTATDNPSEATMQFSYGSRWTAFTSSTSFAASTIYAQTGKRLYLRLLVDGKVMDKETIPVVEDGENGLKGDDAVVYSLQCSPAAVNFRSNAVGEFIGSYTVGCKVMKTVGNNTTEVAASGGTYDGMYLKCRKLNTSGNYTSWNAASSATLTPSYALTNHYVAVEFALSANSGMTAVKARVSVPIMCDGHRGAQGEQGATGKMFYPMGEWNAQTTYSRTGDLVPLVFLPDPGHYNEKIGAEGNYFYLYDNTSTGTRPSVNDQTGPWRLCNDFGVVITQGLFAEYAKLGKGIFCGDFLFSMNGYIGDVEYADGANYGSLPAYTRFNPMFPYGKGIVDIEQILTVCTQEEVQGFVTDYVPLTKAFKLLDGDTYIIRVRGYVSNPAYDGHLCLTTKNQQGYTEDLYVGGCKNTTETEMEFTFNNAVADEYQISAIITYNGNITSWSTPTANFTQPSSNQIIVYKWATSTPAKPTGTSSTPSGWSRYIPAQPDNNYTLYASYGTKAVSSGAFNITSIEIECTVSTAFKPVWWVDLRTGKMSAARGNFVVEANGNVMIDGVIRSRNLYRNVCIFMDGGRYSSDWWYVAQITDGTPAGLKVGDYFTGEFPDPANNSHDGMIRCAYGADTIIMVPVVSGYKWRYNTAVMLPDPTTFDGKTVEILCKADGANSGISILVGCVVSDAFRLYAYYDGRQMQYPTTSSLDTLTMTPTHYEAMYSLSGGSHQMTGYKEVVGKMVLHAENGKWLRIE